jgi:hypothetical protein
MLMDCGSEVIKYCMDQKLEEIRRIEIIGNDGD